MKREDQLKRKYGPGVWEDIDGGLHFDIPAILKHLNTEDTPANREAATKLFLELLREQCPDTKIILRP